MWNEVEAIEAEDAAPRPSWLAWVGLALATACAVYVFVRLEPRLLFRDTTTNGGDTGAHVWWPAYLRDHVLPFRLSGWAPDWYAGFPVGHFYFPLPAVAIVALDLVLPYNVAFKLVTVAGPVALPLGAYFCARRLRAPWPTPPLAAVAVVMFLFFVRDTERSHHIMGGNLASTLAGEFSFTLALATALFFLGALGHALRTRRNLAWPAALLGATVLCHIIVGAFAAGAAVVVWLLHRPLRSFRVALAIGSVGALLTLVWALPMLFRQTYTSNMRYERIEVFVDNLLVRDPRLWVLVAVAIGAGVGFLRRWTAMWAILAVAFAVLFRVWPEHHVWNIRWLPFYYLALGMLAATGAAELLRVLAWLATRVADAWSARAPATAPADGAPLAGEVADPEPAPSHAARPDAAPTAEEPGAVVVADPPRTRRREQPATRSPVFSIVATALVAVAVVAGLVAVDRDRGYLPGWITWNYSGYESKPAWPELESIFDTMGELPPGRALWEPSGDINVYGTTLALELLPYFTDGRIGSMEGLYFESATTTPYHFITVSELTAPGKASNPMRRLPYGTIEDFDLGVRHLQAMGVRYFMAQSDDAKQRADAHPDLRRVAEIPDRDGVAPQGWNVYEVADAPLVTALPFEPVVVDDLHQGPCAPEDATLVDGPVGSGPACWERTAVGWWRDGDALDRPFTTGGPDAWPRVERDEVVDAPRVPLPAVEVTDVEVDEERISFRVSEPGVPVLVRTSYFPKWSAEGADGPWRAAPNFMVVVPTEEQVTLRYGREGLDWLGLAGTLLGVAGLVALARWRPDARRGPVAAEPAPEPDEPVATDPAPPPAEGDDEEPRARPPDPPRDVPALA